MNRDLHPVAWWGWALGLAAAATFTINPIALVGLMLAATLVVVFRRGDTTWARSFRLYLWLALVIVVIRVAFRIIFPGPVGPNAFVLLDLPSVPLPQWVQGVQLLGPVTVPGVLSGLYDGLRLAAIVIAVGAANSLANPKRLLASVPAALYEVGTVLVVAVSIFSQLADSARRVKAAQTLRGYPPSSRVGRLRRFLVPVLEDSLERSLALAAGMDTRGYGRDPGLTPAQRRTTGALLLAGLCGVGVGSYALLDRTAPRALAWPMLTLGVACAVAGLWAAGRRVRRTRYRPDPWKAPEFAVLVCGVVVGSCFWWVAYAQPAMAFPALDLWPSLAPMALVGVLMACLPAWLAPPPEDRS